MSGGAQVDVDPFLRRVLDLVGALRRSGVGATQAEAIDAARAVTHVGLARREELRETLAAVLITARTHRRTFDELFELYFPARPDAPRPGSTRDRSGPDDGATGAANDRDQERADDLAEEPSDEQLRERLADAIRTGDEVAVRELARQAVEAFGRVDGRDGTASYFQYRVDRAVDVTALLRDLVRRAEADHDGELGALERALLRDGFAARVRAYRHEVATDVRRRSVARRGRDHVVDRTVRAPVDELDLFHLTAAEQAELQAEIRPLARKLATRLALRRRHARRGPLDVRRTVRRSLSTGGVPFETVHRPRRVHEPELFVICDVSGSVASFARFTLHLVHALQEGFGGVRSFAFIDTLDEVTAAFEGDDAARAVERMMHGADLVRGDGHSDYGRSLERFRERYADDLGRRSTLLVLGDARNNHRPANVGTLRELRGRARHVYWLNPEPQAFWDTGDSVAAGYAGVVDEMVEVRTLRHLARFVERLG